MSAENWYVYYPAPPAPESVLPRLQRMQRSLQASAGVRARLEARVDATRPTWMEVYENVTDARTFGAALEREALALGLGEPAATRRIERFRVL